MSRRLTASLAAIVAVVALALGISSCGGDSGGAYQVRALFYNAFTVIPGADVKSAGVVIGTVRSLDIQDRKAAIVLDITDPAFQDFRKDATCQIRPQSLLGERFVECQLTRKRAPGQPEPAKLAKIEDGPGKGQYLLPETNTINPIDLDLVNNTLRLPYRQRLTIILNELGVGLAGNGKALRQAVRAANPTLRATEQILAIFAEQNKTLARIAEEGDRALAPLARDRGHIASAIEAMNTTAQATAERSSELEAGLEKLPATLREVRPTMAALNAMTEQLMPIARDLQASGKDLSRVIIGAGAAAPVGTPATRELADTLDVGRDALLASEPVLRDGQALARSAQPAFKNLSDLLTSLKTTNGLPKLMDTFYFTTAATNGYDEDGHYLRAHVIASAGMNYTNIQGSDNSKFTAPASASAAAKAAGIGSGASRAAGRRRLAMPNALFPGSDRPRSTAVPAGLGRTKTPTTDGQTAVLDYLLGD